MLKMKLKLFAAAEEQHFNLDTSATKHLGASQLPKVDCEDRFENHIPDILFFVKKTKIQYNNTIQSKIKKY